jgi:membrane protein implicated in regulation of membrane protease activity
MNSGDLAPVIVSIVMFVSAAAVFILRGPLGKAWARRIEGTSSQTPLDVEQLQGRVAELEQQVDRLHELEERLDFAERLLAQGREPARIEERR